MDKLKRASYAKVIATRHVKAGTTTKVTVRLMAPYLEKDSTWVCAFAIRGLGRSPINAGYGIDAFQALQNALEAIRVRLEQSGRRLSWVERDDPGFPRYVPYFFGSAVSRRLSRLVDREVESFARDVLRRKKKFKLSPAD
jgi:hypothetical protein